MVIGAAIRHFFNLRHQGRNVWAIPVVGRARARGLAFWLRPPETSSAGRRAGAVRARAARSSPQRCAVCHSLHPTQPGFSAPPKGIAFDTPEQIEARGVGDRAAGGRPEVDAARER